MKNTILNGLNQIFFKNIVQFFKIRTLLLRNPPKEYTISHALYGQFSTIRQIVGQREYYSHSGFYRDACAFWFFRHYIKVDDATEERVHIYGSEYDTLYKSVRSPLDMPNARWEIALAPEESWVDLRRLVILIVFSVLLVLAVTFLAVLVIQQYMNAHKLAELAKIDQLTGLFSRQSAIHAMEKELENASDGSRFGLCFIDMNNFKRINDTFGHTTGDAALSARLSRKILWRVLAVMSLSSFSVGIVPVIMSR